MTPNCWPQYPVSYARPTFASRIRPRYVSPMIELELNAPEAVQSDAGVGIIEAPLFALPPARLPEEEKVELAAVTVSANPFPPAPAVALTTDKTEAVVL